MVSAQSECSIIKLSGNVKDSHPLLADFLLHGRFVNDLENSAETFAILRELIEDADMFFKQVSLDCKVWSLSGSIPFTEVCLSMFIEMEYI